MTDETVSQEVVNETETPSVEEAATPETAVAEAQGPETAVEEVKTPPVQPSGISWGTGRRKSSVARVRLYEGTGRMALNGRSLEEYFPELALRLRVLAPLRTVEAEGKYDIEAKIEGGGFTGQSDALRLGISRALVDIDPELRTTLKKEGFLRRDARRVERKKYGLRKARRAPQFTKR